MQNGIVKYKSDSGDVELSPQIIRQYLVAANSGVTDQEVGMFLNLCKYQKLNPFLREVYLIKFKGKPATMVTGKEVFTKRAMKNPNFAGMEAGVVIVRNGEVQERAGAIVLKGEELVGGWAKVYKKGYTVPIQSTASMEEYCRYTTDYTTGQKKPMSMWASMPATMIRKVALVQALREAFPDDFGGLYSQEEMPVDVAALPQEVPNVPKKNEPKVIKSNTNITESKQKNNVEVIKSNTKVTKKEKPPKDVFVTEESDFVNVDDVKVIDVEIEDIQKEILKESSKLICTDCGENIKENVSKFSISKFGKPLCFSCQKKQNI